MPKLVVILGIQRREMIMQGLVYPKRLWLHNHYFNDRNN